MSFLVRFRWVWTTSKGSFILSENEYKCEFFKKNSRHCFEEYHCNYHLLIRLRKAWISPYYWNLCWFQHISIKRSLRVTNEPQKTQRHNFGYFCRKMTLYSDPLKLSLSDQWCRIDIHFVQTLSHANHWYLLQSHANQMVYFFFNRNIVILRKLFMTCT